MGEGAEMQREPGREASDTEGARCWRWNGSGEWRKGVASHLGWMERWKTRKEKMWGGDSRRGEALTEKMKEVGGRKGGWVPSGLGAFHELAGRR